MASVYKKMSSHGSVSIPVAVRRSMGMEGGDPMEIEELENGSIVIRPYQPRCLFCKSTESVQLLRGKGVCEECRKLLANNRKGESAWQ